MSFLKKTLSKNEFNYIYNNLTDYVERNAPTGAYWQLKAFNCIITAYKSGILLVQGKDENIELARDYLDSQLKNIKKIRKNKINNKNNNKYKSRNFDKKNVIKDFNKPKEIQQHNIDYVQSGSDEVGTGDYFGPICVVACAIKQEDVDYLINIGVKDSKLLTDDKILKLAPILMSKIKYTVKILTNLEYNQYHLTKNMNEIKSYLHNLAFIELSNELGGLPEVCIVDQFTTKENYYRYLAKEKQIIFNLSFETKAENKYLSVACSSIIARYIFLEQINELNKKYDFEFCKGARNTVDVNGCEFVELYGLKELKNVAKLHFANTQKIINKLLFE